MEKVMVFRCNWLLKERLRWADSDESLWDFHIQYIQKTKHPEVMN